MAPVRVVVADDSDIYRTSLCDFLQHLTGFTVVAVAQDGAEALRLVEATAPDLLILDLEMPNLDGWGVMHRLQELGISVRILILSSHADAHTQQHALASGAAAYVSKGDVQRLADTLQQLR